ncbi:MOSC domain-containing protein [Myxosarcina sp. GI1(2024)]
MIVSEIYIYPIKSCQGIKLQRAKVMPKGFVWDREMMLVTKTGKCLTQRQYPLLAKVRVNLNINNETITLSSEDESVPALTFISTPDGTKMDVEIWGDRTVAIDQGDEAAGWFHRFLELEEGKECRLVRQSLDRIRSVDRKHSVRDSERVSLADSYPYLLTATASLEELNQRILEINQQPRQVVSMSRFRPNIVLTTETPFIEDRWQSIQIGEVKFKVVKPCSRCIITTIDQKRGEKNSQKEPLRTLGSFRQFSEQGVMFGEYMIPRNTGIVRVGDRLKVLKVRS